ncbi:MAG: hypothetical protein A2Z16_05490 [Chloroflexi bacterium RBG_16_54_18]|nr:MAG: hypothetical protein A2Z16_05490 [Chloroflexi bacterium RBG_16_54_18]
MQADPDPLNAEGLPEFGSRAAPTCYLYPAGLKAYGVNGTAGGGGVGRVGGRGGAAITGTPAVLKALI